MNLLQTSLPNHIHYEVKEKKWGTVMNWVCYC